MLILNKTKVFDIFEKNLIGKLINIEGLDVIKLSAKDALVFNSITESSYINNTTYPYSLYNQTKVFANAFDANIINGIFKNNNFFNFENSPLILSGNKEFLFEGDKYILPIEFNDEYDYLDQIKKIYYNVLNPNNFIVLRIDKSKKGRGMESFLEYLACVYFKKSNFIVENQVPLNFRVGIPDFSAFYIKDLQEKLKEKNIISNGFNLLELSLIRLFGNIESNINKNISKNYSIVGEAKVESLKSSITRIEEKYIKTDFYNEGLCITPNDFDNNKFSILTLNKELKIIYKTGNKLIKYPKNQIRYLDWYKNYSKFYLIANFKHSELMEFDDFRKIKNYKEFVNYICELPLNYLLNKINQIND